MNIFDFQKMKEKDQKISMVTCYDYCSAKILATSNIDCILVGDSAAMVMHGYPNTLSATVEMLVYHLKAVSKGAPNKFIIGDLPFCSFRKGLSQTMDNVELMVKAGACAVKLEGADDNIDIIKHIINSGIPVMGHLGLTAQYFHTIGGFKVQGKDEHSAKQLLEQAKSLEEAGCFAIVLECIPYTLARQITEQLSIPTIGIGAGPYTSGQVLVFQDLLGIQNEIKLKFLKTYLAGFSLMQDALNQFNDEVKQGTFPSIEENCFTSNKQAVAS